MRLSLFEQRPCFPMERFTIFLSLGRPRKAAIIRKELLGLYHGDHAAIEVRVLVLRMNFSEALKPVLCLLEPIPLFI